LNRFELYEYIYDTYRVRPDYPWDKYSDYAVFRHHNNKKWFAVIMNLEFSKLGLNTTGRVDVVNLKSDPILIGSLRCEKGIFPAYHMNKNHWISVLLDEAADCDKIKWLIDLSFSMTE